MTRVHTPTSNVSPRKYIFVVGGVMSGVGKGITTSSIGTVLDAAGYRVSLIKADPYLNVDAGTMNPTEHGEVFVLDSGLECDQDMGNYERFLNKTLPRENYMTNGMVFKHVIDKERRLEYGGKCVEPTYHITEEILRRIEASVEKTDAEITVFEIGGTVGEYQNAIFIEAARLLKLKHPRDVMFVMVSYLPVPSMLGEMKTKPTQNAVRQLNSYGVSPDIIVARSDRPLDEKRKEKIANMCGVPAHNVVSAPDVESIYDVPVNFEKDGLSDTILEYFGLTRRQEDLIEWRDFLHKFKNPTKEVRIAVVGKYFDTGEFTLADAYISVLEALKISAADLGLKARIEWVNAKDFEKDPEKVKDLESFDGILVPGGFGESGIEGKIRAIQYAREHKIPYFGLCYGMQLMVIEYARHVVGLEGAHTTEIDKEAKHPVVAVMDEQKEKLEGSEFGGSMRLGAYPCVLREGTIAHSAYSDSEWLKTHRAVVGTRQGKGTDRDVQKTNEVDTAGLCVDERHRHRYEINNQYIEQIENAGLVFSGTSPDRNLMEIAELPQSEHPFMLGVQFHPEFLARPLDPHPLFSLFLKAASDREETNLGVQLHEIQLHDLPEQKS